MAPPPSGSARAEQQRGLGLNIPAPVEPCIDVAHQASRMTCEGPGVPTHGEG